jgi:hypothetical protein
MNPMGQRSLRDAAELAARGFDRGRTYDAADPVSMSVKQL